MKQKIYISVFAGVAFKRVRNFVVSAAKRRVRRKRIDARHQSMSVRSVEARLVERPRRVGKCQGLQRTDTS